MRRRDEVITLIGDATTAGSRRYYLTDRIRALWEEAVAWDDPQARELDNERYIAVEELRAVWGRTEIRFPRDSDVQQRFNDWRTALDDYSMAVRFGYRTGRPYVQEMMKIEERRRLAGQAADRWLTAARAAVAAIEQGEPAAPLDRGESPGEGDSR